MITPHRYRHVKLLVKKLLDPTSAELFTLILTSWIGKTTSKHLAAAQIFVPDEDKRIDLPLLAIAARRANEDIWTWVREADRAVREALGFSMFDSVDLASGSDPQPKDRISLSAALLDLLAGQPFTLIAAQNPPVPSLADVATLRWLDLVATSVRQGQGGAFLYRRSNGPPAADFAPLLNDLRCFIGDCRMFVAAQPGYRPPTLSSMGILLSAALHLDPDDLLVLPHVPEIGEPAPDANDDDHNAFAEPDVRASSSSHKALSLLIGQAPASLLIGIAASTRLAPEAAKPFAGVFGPYRYDLTQAAESLVATSPGGALDFTEAHRLIAMFGSPRNTRGILKTAAVLARAAVRTEQSDSASEDESAPPEWFDNVFNESREDDSSWEAFKWHFNRLARDLARSFAPHLPMRETSYTIHASAFDPDLFISEPPAVFLFERAAALRAAGARIVLAGPPGTGKTALVGELSRRMGLPVRQYGGAQLFARAWGEAERRIEAAVRDSRGSILFLDEADALLGARDDAQDHNLHLTITATNAFLSTIQEPQPESPIMIATNRLAAIDVGIRRRFDIVLTTLPLPADKERLAWQRLIGLDPPETWMPLGGTVPADYTKARRQMAFLGVSEFDAARSALMRARDEREGDSSKISFGFLG